MVLRDGGRSGVPGRRAKAASTCGRIRTGSPPCAAHVFLYWRHARSYADRVLSCRQNGAVLSRCGKCQGSGRGCSFHGAIRNGAGGSFSVLDVIEQADELEDKPIAVLTRKIARATRG